MTDDGHVTLEVDMRGRRHIAEHGHLTYMPPLCISGTLAPLVLVVSSPSTPCRDILR